MATWNWSGDIEIGTSGQRIVSGTGDPEGVVTAPIGSIYFRVDGGSNHAVYIKEGGTGNTGWTAIGASGTTITLRHDGSANSLQNILDLLSGNGMTISDLGSGQIQINGPTFKHDGSNMTFQKTLDVRAGTSISISDLGSGRLQINALPQVSIQVGGVSSSSQSTLNFVAGTNMTIQDLGSGQIQFTAASGASPSSVTGGITTATLAPLSGDYDSTNTESGFLHLAKSCILLKVTVSNAARVRLYKNAAFRDADLTRPVFIPPTPGTDHGVLADLQLDGVTAGLVWDLAPVPVLTNLDSPRSDKIYYNITNIGSTSQAITASFLYVSAEG